MLKFTVLISVYYKDNPTFFDQALESITINQTLLPNEIIVVKDGQLNQALENVLEKYINKFPDIIKIVALSKNQGLGKALNAGLKYCSYNLVARMDSDDISKPFRFEKQIEFFEKNSNISVLGSNIEEFFDTPENIKFLREVPTYNNEIGNVIKRRNPMNHVTVMFKKQDIEKCGGYLHLSYLEDYYLWARVYVNGFTLHNLDESFVKVRTGEDMYKRRGNIQILKGWLYLQRYLKTNKVINTFEIYKNITKMTVFICIPPTIKAFLYKYFLRKNINHN